MVNYTKKFAKDFEIPGRLRHDVIRPNIFKAIGNVKDKKVVDMGCGSGYFSRMLAAKGAKVTGIDSSKEQISIAVSRGTKNIRYLLDNITSTKLKSNSFDIAMLSLVLIELPLTVFIKVIKETHRLLKKGGLLFIGDRHPFNINKPTKLGYRLIKDNYFANGQKGKSIGYRIDGKKMVFHGDHHYTLEFYINTLIENGFSIKRFLEPKCDADFPAGMIIVAENR